jgi:hypothetical protein
MNAMTTRVCLRLTLRVLLMTATPAAAHDHDRPALDGWYAHLHNKRTIPCCDGSDAARVEDADWDTKDGHYRVRLPGAACSAGAPCEGVWVDVPDGAVVEEPNKDGRTLVWPYYINGMPVVRCFLPGSMT